MNEPSLRRPSFRGVSELLPMCSAAFAAVAWGMTPVGTRFLLSSFSPSEVISIRFSITFVISIFLLVASDVRRWPLGALLRSAGWSLLGLVAYQLLITDALNHTDASSAGIILGSEPLILLIIDSIWHRRKPSGRVSIAVLVGLIGVIVVVGGQGHHANSSELYGDLLILTAAICWALYIVGTRPISATLGSAGLSAISVASSSLLLALISFGSLGSGLAKLSVGSGLVFAGLVLFATVLGFVAWTYGSSRLSSSEVGLFLYLTPVASVVGGITLLGEGLSLRVGLGALLIVSALVLSFRRRSPSDAEGDRDIRSTVTFGAGPADHELGE